MVRDRDVVAAQIGRSPRGRFAVCVRCSHGYPKVIQVHPVLQSKPFPTLYWLTCPLLSREIDGLEAAGWVKRLESRIASEEDLRSAMQVAHLQYVRHRNLLLSSDDIEHLVAGRLMTGLQGRGIGGITDWNRLKCLHLHVAHALADANPIGDMVLSLLPSQECAAGKVICSAYG
jgi:uncharacterized protein